MGDYSLYRNYFINTSANYFWFEEIDFVKGFAIFSVILLHALPKNILFLTLAPFHIWHAVPIFMMIAGLNASISIFRRGSFKISREYSFARFKVYFTRLLVPFSLIWIIEVLILIASGEATSKKIFFSYLYGGMGPGSYFTPLFLQHLIFFPIVLWIKERLNLFLGDYYTIAFFFGLSVFAEYLCIFFNCPNWIYRMLYVRYLFFAVVGSYLFVNSFSKKFVYVFIVLGFIYIYLHI